MFKRILLPTDGSKVATKGALGIELAKALGAEVIAFTVMEPIEALYTGSEMASPVPPEFYAVQRQRADVILKVIHDAAMEANVSCQVFKVNGMHVWREIIERAKEKGCDLIVMGSHGRHGFASFLWSETQQVLNHSTIPVLVIR